MIKFANCRAGLAVVAVLVPGLGVSAAAQQTTLEVDPTITTVSFTLDAALHSVHGIFQAKATSLEFDRASGRLSGEIQVDAKSGSTNNGMRDRKMHKEVLESALYPEISFRPDQVQGTVASTGKSSVKVHGMFSVHGVTREIALPAEVEMTPTHWAAAAHFTVPYAKWGMKNPSNLFLHVSDSVEIDLNFAGKVVPAKVGSNSVP